MRLKRLNGWASKSSWVFQSLNAPPRAWSIDRVARALLQVNRESCLFQRGDARHPFTQLFQITLFHVLAGAPFVRLSFLSFPRTSQAALPEAKSRHREAARRQRNFSVSSSISWLQRLKLGRRPPYEICHDWAACIRRMRQLEQQLAQGLTLPASDLECGQRQWRE